MVAERAVSARSPRGGKPRSFRPSTVVVRRGRRDDDARGGRERFLPARPPPFLSFRSLPDPNSTPLSSSRTPGIVLVQKKPRPRCRKAQSPALQSSRRKAKDRQRLQRQSSCMPLPLPSRRPPPELLPPRAPPGPSGRPPSSSRPPLCPSPRPVAESPDPRTREAGRRGRSQSRW